MVTRIFLLDDDPVFCKLMAKAAKRRGVQFTACSSLREFGSLRSHHEFDVAVIDYYLEDLTGCEIACLLEDKPVVMVSETEVSHGRRAAWPDCVRDFIQKQDGPDAILNAAMSASAGIGDLDVGNQFGKSLRYL